MKALLASLLLALSGQGSPQDVWSALSGADFTRAWELAEGQADELLRARSTSEVLYRAGDPSGALERALAGLASHPNDLELLYRATGAALWLEAPELARHYSSRLELALGGARTSLTPEEAGLWEAAARDFEDRTRSLEHHEAARARAVATARALSFGVLTVVLGLIAWASARCYGRSSSPVS